MISWDCFDTLIARRRIDPLTVFDAMGEDLGLLGFTQRRKAAESRAPWNLDAIYDELAKDYGWLSSEKAYYKNAEIVAEIAHCVPIDETIRQVSDGDLIVSDMYLPAWAIERMLRKCGLDKDVRIVVSAEGKKKGTIWASLPPIAQHVGDNPFSDVASPQACGIEGVLFTKSTPTQLEQQIGGDLALLMRAVRLANPYEPDTVLHSMWYEQAQLNIPALALAALEMPALGVCFVMRDCVHLQPIHEAIHGTINPTFHCSRLAFRNSSPLLRKHAEEVALGRTIIDLQGSGASVHEYWQSEFGSEPDLLYVTGLMKHGQAMVPCNHDAIERFNSNRLGSIGREWPHRLPCEHSEVITSLQHNAVKCALSHMPLLSIAPNLNQLKALIGMMTSSVTVMKNYHCASHE